MTAPLPYGPTMTAILTPLRKAFFVLNHWVAAPLIRAGGGPLLTTPVAGSILLLRTTGWKSGLLREAPLGYAVIDGRIVVVAGYGRSAITPTAVRPGAFDPGGAGTRINTALWVLLGAAGFAAAMSRRREPGRHGSSRLATSPSVPCKEVQFVPVTPERGR